MGSVVKLKNGKFRTTVYDIHGIRHRKTFTKKAEADAYITKLESLKHEAKLVSHKLRKRRYLIEDAINNFMLTKNDLRPKTLQKYRYFVEQFKLFCGHLKIIYVDEFTNDIALAFQRAISKEKRDPKGSTDRILKPASRTSNYYLTKARMLFQAEVVIGHIDRNPFLSVNNFRVERKPPEYYSKEELKKFFAQDMHVSYRNAFTVLLHSGMRFAELANLTWDDIDFGNKLIHVRPKTDFKTKTYNSIRSIVMDETLHSLFTELAKNKSELPYVLLSVEGRKLRERMLYYWCNVIGKKAGIEGTISLHKFRHTFASMLVQHNTRIEVVQKLLGHSTIKETMIYAHIRAENLHAEVSVMDKLFGELNKKLDTKNTNQ